MVGRWRLALQCDVFWHQSTLSDSSSRRRRRRCVLTEKIYSLDFRKKSVATGAMAPTAMYGIGLRVFPRTQHRRKQTVWLAVVSGRLAFNVGRVARWCNDVGLAIKSPLVRLPARYTVK